jgi:methionyl-tRNA formyltransferase
MRIVFMGSPTFSVLALQKIIDAGHNVVSVYAQPPREKGRGHHVQKNPVHVYAESMNIPVLTPMSLRTVEAQDIFRSHNADIAVVAAYGLILPQEILDAPHMGCLNIHASLLPRWRGAAPIQRAIIAGDPETGITIMQMDQGLDTGNMLYKQSVPISDQTTSGILHDALSVLGSEMIVKVLSDYATFKENEKIQPTDGVTYADKLLKEEGNLDFTKSAEQLDQEIRGLSPYVSCWVMINENRYKIIKSQQDMMTLNSSYAVISDALYIQCASGSLKITMIQREGGKPMTIAEFLKGHTF